MTKRNKKNKTNKKNEKQTYIDLLTKTSDIKILQRSRAKEAYKNNGPLGLFYLFMSTSMFSAILNWTNDRLAHKGQKTISMNKLQAYFALEIAASFNKRNDLSMFWSNDNSIGSKYFIETMSRNQFKTIRANISFYFKSEFDIREAFENPLYHVQNIMNLFNKNCISVAIPTGASALDESSIRTKARTKAKCYNPNKPDKFGGLRYYAIVSWKRAYVHTIVNNGAGNTSSKSIVEQYVAQNRILNTLFCKNFIEKKSTLLEKNSPSALWAIIISHQYVIDRSICPNPGKRIIFTDSYYTRHALALAIEKLTKGNVRIIGTMKGNFLDSLNRERVKKAVTELASKNRGAWQLLQVYEKGLEYDKLKRQHDAKQKQIDKEKRKRFNGPFTVAKNAGYIVVKDTKVLVLYTNDLSKTPLRSVLDGSSEEAVECVHGLTDIARFCDADRKHRKLLQVPAPFDAYNRFMNSVDRFDQRIATFRTQRKERRISMSVFTAIIDWVIHNAYVIYEEIFCATHLSFLQFKMMISKQLSLKSRREYKKKTNWNTATVPLDRLVENLMQNKPGIAENEPESENEMDECMDECLDEWADDPTAEPIHDISDEDVKKSDNDDDEEDDLASLITDTFPLFESIEEENIATGSRFKRKESEFVKVLIDELITTATSCTTNQQLTTHNFENQPNNSRHANVSNKFHNVSPHNQKQRTSRYIFHLPQNTEFNSSQTEDNGNIHEMSSPLQSINLDDYSNDARNNDPTNQTNTTIPGVRNETNSKVGGHKFIKDYNTEEHVLLRNKKKKDGRTAQWTCYICRICNVDPNYSRTCYSCHKCGQGFHVQCFSLYHHPNAFGPNSAWIKLIESNIVSNNTKRRNKRSKEFPALQDCVIEGIEAIRNKKTKQQD